MDRVETLLRLKDIDAEIKALNDEKEILRLHAVAQGWARWVTTIRFNAPNLAWWKENRPRTWEKYATPSKVKRFEVAE